jgi:hypothetical protein
VLSGLSDVCNNWFDSDSLVTRDEAKFYISIIQNIKLIGRSITGASWVLSTTMATAHGTEEKIASMDPTHSHIG